ncbi:MAG: dTDP-4-dehydrorhamnose 3,5-epimerase family protein [Calditrichaceae bacterium]|nr:dTDP-4-dehydrorhamnose 3,5-epimerase family protein [Calditrichaceae bacterium]MBN2707865.1 dTDP-4-dehydrorhamnose 3,5-epimerase family protein [Calditrichaceae bacterium]RQV94237.1 MAG: dTDP-4-dehydrorhamnose 3,5-epimerase [Calditrichota bacterium]
MNFEFGDIDGVIIKELIKREDARGWLTEIFRQDEISRDKWPVMNYVSETKPGVARGPHEHVDQTDYFGFLGPSDFKIYLWDSREKSGTYGKRMVVTLGEVKPGIVVIPPGVVHAYRNTGTIPGWVINLPNRLYAGWQKKEPVDEIRHEDKQDSIYKLD